MCGWFRNIWIFSYRMNCSVIYSYFSICFYITFRAQMKEVVFYCTRSTFPYLPTPSSDIFSKSARLNFFSCFLRRVGDDFIQPSAVGSKLLFLIMRRY